MTESCTKIFFISLSSQLIDSVPSDDWLKASLNSLTVLHIEQTLYQALAHWLADVYTIKFQMVRILSPPERRERHILIQINREAALRKVLRWKPRIPTRTRLLHRKLCIAQFPVQQPCFRDDQWVETGGSIEQKIRNGDQTFA